ncbi:hypothetical protein GCM10010129_68590 [Streptomyces fumigatiscleroticus]|nr:hypothetical protein GCM10010129_68590 [Streptomyces fumigatiscleroticus]
MLERAVGSAAVRRFTECTGARAAPHRLVPDGLGARGELNWSRCAIDAVSPRAMKEGT